MTQRRTTVKELRERLRKALLEAEEQRAKVDVDSDRFGYRYANAYGYLKGAVAWLAEMPLSELEAKP